MQDDAFRAAVDKVDEGYIAEWRRRDGTPEHRVSLWHKVQALTDVVRMLRSTYEQGNAATVSAQRADRLRDAGL
jgi:hypothetical protein